MSTLLLKFGINLEEYSLSIIAQHHGPLFHRWLPDGEKDAIVLDTGDSNIELRVWFERRGFVDNGFIKFDYKRREVNPEIIPKQAILDAGPLWGLLKIQGLSEEELAPLWENAIGDDRYVALGKKVVKNLLYPPVARFLNILRTNYGQYWIRELEKWDSREESLGHYCKSLNLKWSLDGGKTWTDFFPNNSLATPRALEIRMGKSFPEFPTKEDWQKLAKVVRDGYEPSLAAFILARAHQFLDQGSLKYAFIEGVSALELALNEFIRQKLDGADSLLGSMKAFWNLPLSAQAITVATILGKIPLQDIEYTIKAIDMRNKVIHEGWSPPDNAKVELSGLLNTVAALLKGPRFRFPSANPGNAIMPPEDWEQQAEKKSHGG